MEEGEIEEYNDVFNTREVRSSPTFAELFRSELIMPPLIHSQRPRGGEARSQVQRKARQHPDAIRQVPDRNEKANPYLFRRDKRNIVEYDGDVNIPFSAIRINEYKVFVTNISPTADLEAIRKHVVSTLHANVALKLLSKPGASVLSFGLHCTSESDKLDLKMPGLWPNGTRIHKWRSNTRNRRFGNQSQAPKSQGHYQARHGASTSHEAQGRRRSSKGYRNYPQLSQGQLQLHSQWED